MRTMLKGKIHRARVTDSNINYEGSITIDRKLMEAADILPYEQVDVVNVNNGARFTTYAIEGEQGEICVNGAAARLALKGVATAAGVLFGIEPLLGLATLAALCAASRTRVVTPPRRVRVDRYVIGVDCGLVVNPDGVEAQMQSCIAFALSAALKQRITIREGGVVERSYLDFPVLTYGEMPTVEVHIVRNTLPVGGVGELGIGGCAPALCNAIFSATGKRIRTLPVETA